METPVWGVSATSGQNPGQVVPGGSAVPDWRPFGSGGGRRFGAATRGLKFLVVCGLAVLMSLLALFVAWLTEDRTTRAASVRGELSTEAGGPQSFLGPTVFVPYTEPAGDPKQQPIHSVFAFAASTGRATVQVHAEERRRSLYRVPVIESDVALQASFTIEDLQAALPKDATAEWDDAVVGVGVSNVRSALADAVLENGGSTDASRIVPAASVRLEPRKEIDTLSLQSFDERAGESLQVLSAPLSAVRGRGGPFTVTAKLRFRGAEKVTVLPYSQATTVMMSGDWPSPGFKGQVLPAHREMTKTAFAADWFLPSVARGMPAANDVAALGNLSQTGMTTTLVEVADPYQSVERALKYAPLFLGLVFLSYFLFEVTARRPVHVAQYVLVGVAQLIFYLLLLSFAERIGFDWGFLLGGGATVLLLSVNAGWVFQSARQRWRALGIFSALYAMIYGLLRLEDNALLIGAVGSFVAIAAAMYFTRSTDWYGGGETKPETATDGVA